MSDAKGRERKGVEEQRRQYAQLHALCGKILENSLDKDSHNFYKLNAARLDGLKIWADSLSHREESVLMRTAIKEYQDSTLALLQGQYRQAFKGIRLVLELFLEAIHLSAHTLELREWLDSIEDTGQTKWSSIIDEKEGVLSKRYARAFFPELETDVHANRGLAKKVYQECSECVHGNVQKHIKLPDVLEYKKESYDTWHVKTQTVIVVILFALVLRYWKTLDNQKKKILVPMISNELGHFETISKFVVAPCGAL